MLTQSRSTATKFNTEHVFSKQDNKMRTPKMPDLAKDDMEGYVHKNQKATHESITAIRCAAGQRQESVYFPHYKNHQRENGRLTNRESYDFETIPLINRSTNYRCEDNSGSTAHKSIDGQVQQRIREDDGEKQNGAELKRARIPGRQEVRDVQSPACARGYLRPSLAAATVRGLRQSGVSCR